MYNYLIGASLTQWLSTLANDYLLSFYSAILCTNEDYVNLRDILMVCSTIDTAVARKPQW